MYEQRKKYRGDAAKRQFRPIQDAANYVTHKDKNKTQVLLIRFAIKFTFFLRALTAPSGPGPPHYLGFTITLRHTTLGRIPLDGLSARRRKLYLATVDIRKETSIHTAAGFEPAIAANKRPKTLALGYTATAICTKFIML